MSITISPPHVGERSASDLYPALPEKTRGKISQEEFAEIIERMLIESGDMEENGQIATKKGEKHGLINTMGSGWSLDDNFREEAHFTLTFAMPSEEGEKYVKDMVKRVYPELNEEIYQKLKREKEIAIRMSAARDMNPGFEDLPKEVLDTLKRFVLNEIKSDITYVICDYEDENTMLSAITAYQSVYKNKYGLTVMSGEQICINYKYDVMRGEKYVLRHHLVGTDKKQEYFVIDRIEDVAKDDQAQQFLVETIEYAAEKGVKVLVISESEPNRIFGLSKKLKGLLTNGETFDYKKACREYKFETKRAAESLNVIELLGRLVDDPNLKYTPDNVAVCAFKLAVDRDKKVSGSYRRTDYIECVAWRDMAEKIYREFEKNQLVFIMGRLESREWIDREGRTRTSWEVIVDRARIGEDRKTVRPRRLFCKTLRAELEEDDIDILY